MAKIPDIAVHAALGLERRGRRFGDDAFHKAALLLLGLTIAETAYDFSIGAQDFKS